MLPALGLSLLSFLVSGAYASPYPPHLKIVRIGHPRGMSSLEVQCLSMMQGGKGCLFEARRTGMKTESGFLDPKTLEPLFAAYFKKVKSALPPDATTRVKLNTDTSTLEWKVVHSEQSHHGCYPCSAQIPASAFRALLELERDVLRVRRNTGG